MKFPYEKLRATSGGLSGLIFENPSVGLARGLFLSISFRFAPIRYDDRDWECSLTSDWIPFRGGSWKEFETIDYSSPEFPEHNETSFYMCEHDWCIEVEVSLSYEKENMFKVLLKSKVEFSGYFGDDADSEMPVGANLVVPFTNLTIPVGTVLQESSTPAETQRVASEFIDMNCFEEPMFDGRAFKLHPKWEQ
jgi:hypothetical protein